MKLLTGLILGFIIGVLATIGFLQMRTGQLPSLSTSSPAAVPPPAAGAPAGASPPASTGDTGTPPKP